MGVAGLAGFSNIREILEGRKTLTATDNTTYYNVLQYNNTTLKRVLSHDAESLSRCKLLRGAVLNEKGDLVHLGSSRTNQNVTSWDIHMAYGP